MIIDENYKTVEDICNEIINSNLSDKAKIKTIQALKGEEEKEIPIINQKEEVSSL